MPPATPLQTLARLYNLQTVYHDGLGQLRQAPPEAILSVLQSLGANLESLSGVGGALRARRQELWQRAIDPVTVAWQDRPLQINLRLPIRLAEARVCANVVLENGKRLDCRLNETRDARAREIEGARYVRRSFIVREPLPPGYHRLHFEADGVNFESDLFAAPRPAWLAPDFVKRWGVFSPVYALHSARSWGAGDFSDLAALARFVGDIDGHAVGTLPMLAGFLDEPFNPSPYAPISRLFWNEFFLDLTRVPDLAECAAARAMVESPEFLEQLATVRAQSLVDYRQVMALKRKVLDEMLVYFLSSPSSKRRDRFEEFVAAQAALRDYAAFRAKCERERKTWPLWREEERSGTLGSGAYDERAQAYHLYVQWLCDEQVRWVRSESAQRGVALYLDFPLGVNRDGFDVWRERHLFALRASGGAPPDGLFVKGQNWGFPPFDPGALQRDRYRYYRNCLRHHMSCASLLRIDHVMGLHRAFWVPEGFDAADGLYVHQRAAEYYAVLSLESHRHQVGIVGENLGTVPPYVNEALMRHGILGMHVGQFTVRADAANATESAPPKTVASLNTHDTPTFMGFWTGGDIEDRVALGLITQEQGQKEHLDRAAQRDALTGYLRACGLLGEDASPAEVLKAWSAFLAGGAEEFLLVNLADLWLESEPQNVPGTWHERPNWRRKAAYSIEEIRAKPELVGLLRFIGDMRRRIS